MSADASHHPDARASGSVWYNLSIILLLVALAGVGGAYLIDAMSRNARLSDTGSQTLSRAIGGRTLDIPRHWFRYEEQAAEGFAKQVELRLALPLGAEGATTPIDVTLVPRSRIRPSASLLDGVYLHQFDTAQFTGAPGLVGKPLKAGNGYDGEVVWYDPVSPAPFVAKCGPAVETGATTTCLRMVYLAPGMAAIYSFDPEVLANWRSFDAVLGERMTLIGAL